MFDCAQILSEAQFDFIMGNNRLEFCGSQYISRLLTYVSQNYRSAMLGDHSCSTEGRRPRYPPRRRRSLVSIAAILTQRTSVPRSELQRFTEQRRS